MHGFWSRALSLADVLYHLCFVRSFLVCIWVASALVLSLTMVMLSLTMVMHTRLATSKGHRTATPRLTLSVARSPLTLGTAAIVGLILLAFIVPVSVAHPSMPVAATSPAPWDSKSSVLRKIFD